MKIADFLACASLGLFAAPAAAWTAEEVRVVAQERLSPAPYEQLLQAIKAYNPAFDERSYRRRKPPELYAQIEAAVEKSKITYEVNGRTAAAYLIRPAEVRPKTHPLFIYSPGQERVGQRLLHLLATRSFRQRNVVLVPVLDGREAIGGTDIAKLKSLMALAEQLGYVDTSKAAAYGAELGALRILLALKAGMPLQTAIVMDPPTDLPLWLSERRDLEGSLTKLLPASEEARAALSPLRWAEKVNAPLLILHGRAQPDGSGPDPRHSLLFAQRLEELGKPFRLIVYEDTLRASDAEKDLRVRDWLLKLGHSQPAKE